jgi:hypothetical protein
VEGVKGVTRNLAIFLFVAIVSTMAGACSLAVVHGYFHQVTAIRGRVVGKNLGPFQFRWVRQSFGVSRATLTLYEYRWPAQIEDLKVIATVKADSRGHFDFGSIVKGHYVLVINVPDADLMSASFDVEVTGAVHGTDSITIDVSPIRPDCSGGHEFIENKKS